MLGSCRLANAHGDPGQSMSFVSDTSTTRVTGEERVVVGANNYGPKEVP